ncbi:MAG TPA: hypothetical protein VGL77_14500 [Armatimonadota bacterium]|jgi:membrane protein implicated in regulation of membrane protease activity
MQLAVPALIILGLLGSAAFIAYMLLRRADGYLYLFYLGVTFLALAIALCTPPLFVWLPILLALVALVIAIWEGYRDTKERLRRFREAQRQREQAFGEFLVSVAQQEAKAPAPPEDHT